MSDGRDLDRHLAGIVAGDDEAFARWVAGAEPALRADLRSWAALVDTEAILQETLLRVWQAAPRFAPDGRPNGLLRLAARIARNLAASDLRRRRVRVVDGEALERLLAGVAEITAPSAPDPLLRRHLEECRDKLPERPASALRERLASAGGERDEDLAARLGMRLNTFLQNFGRARKLLAECLAARGVRLEVEMP